MGISSALIAALLGRFFECFLRAAKKMREMSWAGLLSRGYAADCLLPFARGVEGLGSQI